MKTTPAPVMSAAAKPVPTPYLHKATGRTVGHHEPAETGTIHLFSATGVWIATDDEKAAATAAEKADGDAKLARVKADEANAKAHATHYATAFPATDAPVAVEPTPEAPAAPAAQ